MRLYTSKKWIVDDPSVYDISQKQQQYTQRRADAEILRNLGSKPKHEIGGDLLEELLVVVLVHPDVFAGAKPTHEAVVDAAEQLVFFVFELREAVKIVDDVGVFRAGRSRWWR